MSDQFVQQYQERLNKNKEKKKNSFQLNPSNYSMMPDDSGTFAKSNTPQATAPSTEDSALQGGVTGATMGAAGGPWGAAIGGIAGVTTGILSAKAKQEQARIQNEQRSRENIANIIGIGTNRQANVLSNRQQAQASVLAALMR